MRNRKTVLYIEDEPELASLIKEELSTHNIYVVISDNFNDAIRKLNNQKFNAILADIKLKKGSGDQIIESIKSDKKNKNYNTPIFIASGKITNNILSSVGAHINGAFVKPFDFDELIERVKNTVERNSRS